MRLYQTFDKERLTEIARLADNRQIIKDVNYAAFLVFHGARNIYCEWFESAFIIGQYQKKCFRIIGKLDFSLIGILARISKILAESGIGIFAISTYNTDYILTKEENFKKALTVLKNEGYEVKEPS